jgi:GT2 family glycosyltransferase
MSKNPLASIIILTWNGIEYIEDCLDSLLAQDYPEFEVIIVDNASSDGTPDWIVEHFPTIRLIRNERNLGFAAANNLGLQAAAGDVLMLLNQDTVVQPGWLSALVGALLADPGIGIAGSKALYPDGTIQHAGGYVDRRGESNHYGHRQEDVGQFDLMRDVDFVTGAALAITRRAFETIGGLDEGFTPAYYEDVDWCFRAREAGFQVVYIPQALLIHKEASGFAGIGHSEMYLFHRNRLRFVLKHWPLVRLADEFMPAERTWLERLGEGGERLIAAMHHAYLYHLLHLAHVVDWRRKLLGVPLDEADVLADVLLTLRTVVPLRPVQADERGGGTDSWAQLLGELHQRWPLQGQPFRSHIPLFESLIAGFRYVLDRIFVWLVIKRQMEFNVRVVAMLDRLEHDRRRLEEYISENGREMAELAQEIQRLRNLGGTQAEE